MPDVVTGGRPTVGLRVPGHPLALRLLRAFGGGVAAPSANRFGKVSPTTAAHVRADLGADVDLVLDGGPCTVGVESTIVDCTTDPPTLLRHGAVTVEELAATLGGRGRRHRRARAGRRACWSRTTRPAAAVELVPDGAGGRRAGSPSCAGGAGPPTCSTRARRRRLRPAPLRVAAGGRRTRGLDVLVVVPPPDAGIGAAVNERLRKAAAPR